MPSGYTGNLSTNTAGQVRLTVHAAPSNPPVFDQITISNGILTLSGTGGVANASYYVLSTTNLAMPLTGWTRVATNQFDSGGGFSFTNGVDAAVPGRFYLLQLP